jgi:hypothetical protein
VIALAIWPGWTLDNNKTIQSTNEIIENALGLGLSLEIHPGRYQCRLKLLKQLLGILYRQNNSDFSLQRARPRSSPVPSL